MNCLRCGRETTAQQVFCDICLDDMSRHPVKPDVAIHLPVRKPKEPQRRSSRWWRKDRSPEEMVVILRKRVSVLTALVVLLVLMLSAAAAGVWLAQQQGAEISIPNIGQNFKTADDSSSSPTGD